MKILPLSRHEYQCSPLEDEQGNEINGVIEISQEEFDGLQNGEKCFNATLSKVIDNYTTIEEIEEQERAFALGRINELKNLLAESDYKAIKFAEGELTEEEYSPIRAQRREWRVEINRIEKEYKEV